MKVLAIYRYYWPDITPYARILRSILERLSDEGHEATVVTGQPAYNDVASERQPWHERLGGVEVQRVRLLPERKWLGPLRLLNFVLFLGRACWHALFHRYDLVLASSNPPVISGLSLRLIRFLTGAQYVYHCQDLHPECAVLAGKLKKGRIERLLTRVDARTCSRSARTIVLSEDMVAALRERGLGRDNVTVINNFALDVPEPKLTGLPAPFDCCEPADIGLVARRPLDLDSAMVEGQPFRVLFAGNMGSFQGLDKIIEAARILRTVPTIQFVFMGAGEQQANLERQAGNLVGQTVHFLPYLPIEEAFGCMHRAELGIVSLVSGVYKVAYPSKTMMYLAAGCPVLAVIESDSVLAKHLTDKKLGWVPDVTTPKGIAHAILLARESVVRCGLDRHQIRATGMTLFDREALLDDWSTLFAELSREFGSRTDLKRLHEKRRNPQRKAETPASKNGDDMGDRSRAESASTSRPESRRAA